MDLRDSLVLGHIWVLLAARYQKSATRLVGVLVFQGGSRGGIRDTLRTRVSCER